MKHCCSSGSDVMEIINYIFIGYKANSVRQDSKIDKVAKNLKLV